MRVSASPDLAGTARLAVLRLDGMRPAEDGGDALWRAIEESSREIGERWAGLSSGGVPGVDEARRLYRAVGIDPTKTRPSSEALLRRVLKGKGLYRIHPLVDLFNLVSVRSLLPVGLYDEDRIAGDEVVVRIGGEGWGYEGIRRGRINVAGRLCVADREGPFGSPTADSERTSISGAVERALAIFFQPADGDPARAEGALDLASALAAEHLGAAVAERLVLAPARGG